MWCSSRSNQPFKVTHSSMKLTLLPPLLGASHGPKVRLKTVLRSVCWSGGWAAVWPLTPRGMLLCPQRQCNSAPLSYPRIHQMVLYPERSKQRGRTQSLGLLYNCLPLKACAQSVCRSVSDLKKLNTDAVRSGRFSADVCWSEGAHDEDTAMASTVH